MKIILTLNDIIGLIALLILGIIYSCVYLIYKYKDYKWGEEREREIKMELTKEKQQEILKYLVDKYYNDERSMFDNINNDVSPFGKIEVKYVEEMTVVDEGKYQNGGEICVIYLDGVKTDMLIKQTWYRSGSYYSNYCYGYDEPILVKEVTKVIEVTKYVSI